MILSCIMLSVLGVEGESDSMDVLAWLSTQRPFR